MRRLLLIAGLLCAAALTTTALARPSLQQPDPGAPLPPLPVPGAPVPVPSVPPPPSGSEPAGGPPQYVLKVGDTMRVDGARIGCQVTRRAGRVFIECRRAGALAGTYGTFLSDRTATVARFRSSRSAQVVFTATQKGAWRACGRPARASRARAAAGACR
jgi:hypothetical protein